MQATVSTYSIFWKECKEDHDLGKYLQIKMLSSICKRKTNKINDITAAVSKSPWGKPEYLKYVECALEEFFKYLF